MVIAHVLFWTAYGWWLPNDPRGSTSHRRRQSIVTALNDILPPDFNVAGMGDLFNCECEHFLGRVSKHIPKLPIDAQG